MPDQVMARGWFFGFFVASGFCGLVYEIVWLRIAMAQFGVTTALTSIVLSVFMAGLALGSWASGRLARRFATGWAGDRGGTALRLYAVLELLIGVSGLVVPRQLEWGRRLLDSLGVSWGSAGYHLVSGAWVALTLLPFCALMGATFPTAMAAFRAQTPGGSARSFSYLYLANVMGAFAGTVVSAFVLIELLGFRGTARAAATVNALVGLAALIVAHRAHRARRSGARQAPAAPAGPEPAGRAADATPRPADGGRLLALLFATGLMSLAMEVVWIRQFTPYLGSVVYAFATVIALYLLGTVAGSAKYRAWSARDAAHDTDRALAWCWAAAGIAGLLPLVAADPRPGGGGFGAGALRVAVGILPFCAILGFLTPMLVDRWSRGDPDRAGTAYAVNVVGCILGPLLAGFILLPLLGESWALALLAVPPAIVGLAWGLRDGTPADAAARPLRRWRLALAVAVCGALALTLTRSYESRFPERIVRRDSTATVVAHGTGFERRLLVNGFSMTILTPISKMMAHLPIAFHEGPVRNGLVICFGMGTTVRSMSTWDVRSTVVELVPSVPGLVGFYHDDGEALLRDPRVRVVVDDGRRYLERTPERFDVITIDPPPPIEAAGSSLLYSREFYDLAKRRLRPGGILQQWFPGGETAICVSFARTLHEVFPHVRAFGSVEGWGIHFLASERPIPSLSPAELAARLPAAAALDLLEWGPASTPEEQFALVLRNAMPIEAVIAVAPNAPILEDDRPFNEYFLLRRMRAARPAGLAQGIAGVPPP